MTMQRVTQRQILEELRSLEPAHWGQVLDFIGYLKHRRILERQDVGRREMTARDLLESDLVGIWADREDIDDSLAFARRLRRQAEQRRRSADGVD